MTHDPEMVRADELRPGDFVYLPDDEYAEVVEAGKPESGHVRFVLTLPHSDQVFIRYARVGWTFPTDR